MNHMRQLITLIETPDNILYHVTPTRNLAKIMQQGLIPKIGARR
jgi:RNA:NAD 2'-phosphotransferase (TPT1/KptA family)